MTKTYKRLVILLSAAAVTAALTTTAVMAAGTDTDDNISPASTSYKATNSGNVTFSGTVNSLPVTVTCTMSTISGTTPGMGLGPTPISDPVFMGCTDSLGGTDMVTANHNNGSWTVTFMDAANDETVTEPNTGDSLVLGIPKAGATVVSSALSTCTITVAPGGSTSITGGFDDKTTVKFMNQSIPTSGSGCTTSAATTMNGTYVSNVSFHDVS